MEKQISISSEEAFKVFEELRTAIHEHRWSYFVVGRLMKRIRDEKLYLVLNGGYDKFKEFLTDPEVKIRESSTIYAYIRIHEYYILELGMKKEELVDIPMGKLQSILPKLKDLEKEKAIEMLEGIRPLTGNDTDVVIKENNLETDRPSLTRCKKCGKWRFQFRPEEMCNGDVEGDTGGVQIIDKSLLD